MRFWSFKKLINGVLDLLFPARCLGCGTRKEILCNACFVALPRAPIARLLEKNIYACFDYKDTTVRTAIWMLKYRGVRALAPLFASAMYDELCEELGDLTLLQNFHNPLLVPIPLSRKRMRERGYNQAELLAKEFSLLIPEKEITLSVNALLKIKDTPSQMSLSKRGDRLKNLKDAFIVSDPALVRGKNIILIDDVTTTGATLHEAQRVLRAAGARKVIAVVVAH